MKSRVMEIISSRKMLLMLLMGFASGLPISLKGSTLQAWMTDEHVDLKTIGFFSLVGIPYTQKYLWAPLMDRFVPPFLGRRRGWMLICQLALMAVIIAMGFTNPARAPYAIAALAVMLSFFGASQDIVVDAYRAEYLAKDELGPGVGVAILGYRVAMITSGAVALMLAEVLPWRVIYCLMAGLMSIGLIATWICEEPTHVPPPPKTLREAVFMPFVEYLSRPCSIEILAFVILYKFGDVLAVALQTPFLLQMGYSKGEIGAVAKGIGLTLTISGSLLGGLLLAKISLKQALLYFGFLQAVSILCFSILAKSPPVVALMGACIGFENFCNGLGNAAFTACLMGLCNKRFTATQFALLTSFSGLTREFLGPVAAWLSLNFGWQWFFVISTAAAVPGMVLLVARFELWQQGEEVMKA